jgi:enterochelin esterase-like enzyme
VDRLDIIDTWFLVTAWILAGLAVAGAVCVVWRLRRQRVVWSAVTGFVAAVLVLVAAADSVNAHYAYWPTIGDARQALTGDRQWRTIEALDRLTPAAQRAAAKNGLVVKIRIPADAVYGFAATTNIAYLPPQYFTQPGSRFPVVYLFHGTPGKAADWFHAGQAAREGRAVAASGHPAILVAAQMSRSWTDDPECVDGTQEKVESHLVQQVIPTIDAMLRTQSDRGGRVFAGMSAGGYCALNLGLRHRGLVAAIIDLSGDTVPTHGGGAKVLFGKHNPDAEALVAANSPASYAASQSPTPPTRIWLESGTGDKTIVREMSSLARTLTSRGVPVSWRVRPGGHTYHVWTAALHEALAWVLGNSPPGHSGSRPGP